MSTVQKSLFDNQTTIIQMISSGMPLKKILTFIVNSIEDSCDSFSLSGSIMLYNPILKQLGETVFSSLPTNFIRSIEPVDVSPYGGSCGTAAFLKQPVFVTDIENNPLTEKYRHCAIVHGLRACFSTPLLSSKNELLGTIAIYSNVVGKLDEETLNLVNFYSKLASLAIEISTKNHHSHLYTLEIDQRINKSTEKVLTELNTALASEEFEVYYQPIFGVNEQLLGVEALIRWNHPQLGLLSPASFLPVAEETGFILDIEKWVLTQSIYKLKKYHQSDWPNLSLSVNISAQQFDNPRFPDIVAELLERMSFPPRNLTLEVTERFLIHQENIEIVNRLRAIGIKLSIDDFGTSYSSLHYLRDLQVDEIKIDRSFISKLEKDKTSQKIVQMMIKLGHQLNLNIVAEGVETEKQLHILKKMKCDSIQGFLLSKPISFDHLKKMFLSTNERNMA